MITCFSQESNIKNNKDNHRKFVTLQDDFAPKVD